MAKIKWYSNGKITKEETVPDISDTNDIVVIKKFLHNDSYSYHGHRFMAFRKSDEFILFSIIEGVPKYNNSGGIFKRCLDLLDIDKLYIKNNCVYLANNRIDSAVDFFYYKYDLLVRTFGKNNIEM